MNGLSGVLTFGEERVDPSTYDFQSYEGEFEFATDSQWGHVILQLAVGARSEASIQRDPEGIRCYETGYCPSDIYLGSRQYTDDQLGKLDGVGRDIIPDDPIHWILAVQRTAKARLSKRQRSKLRKAKRSAARKGEAFSESEFIKLTFVTVS